MNASETRRLQFAAAEVELQMPDTGNEIRIAHLRLLPNAEKTGQKSQLSPFPWNGNGLRLCNEREKRGPTPIPHHQ
jgi:hypothetical protein